MIKIHCEFAHKFTFGEGEVLTLLYYFMVEICLKCSLVKTKENITHRDTNTAKHI